MGIRRVGWGGRLRKGSSVVAAGVGVAYGGAAMAGGGTAAGAWIGTAGRAFDGVGAGAWAWACTGGVGVMKPVSSSRSPTTGVAAG